MAGKDERTKRKPGKLATFYQETMGELKRVSWPTRAEAFRLTWIVLVVMFIMAVFLWSMDSAAAALLALVLGVK